MNIINDALFWKTNATFALFITVRLLVPTVEYAVYFEVVAAPNFLPPFPFFTRYRYNGGQLDSHSIERYK